MHFAYPPRKDSNPAAFKPRSSRIPNLPQMRRHRTRLMAAIGLVVIGLIFLFARPQSRHNVWMASHVKENGGVSKSVDAIPPGSPSVQTSNFASDGKPKVVLVTMFDETNFHRAYLNLVADNRNQYARRHGYGTFIPRVGDYDLHGSPMTWTKVVAMRDAIAHFPDSTYFWFLEQDAFIIKMDSSVEGDVMGPSVLEKNMIKDFPVVPPDSIIKTFGHLKGEDVDFLLTQDYDGLSTSSFIIRNGPWAQFFFETWFDPIYRSYNFQKAETHALEHIVQWHPTILSKMALVPQRMINAYSQNERGAKFEKGDLAVRVIGCSRTSSTMCENEAQPFIEMWQGKSTA